MRLISKLWAVVLIQFMLFFDSQVRGISMTVGKMTFSFVVD